MSFVLTVRVCRSFEGVFFKNNSLHSTTSRSSSFASKVTVRLFLETLPDDSVAGLTEESIVTAANAFLFLESPSADGAGKPPAFAEDGFSITPSFCTLLTSIDLPGT